MRVTGQRKNGTQYVIRSTLPVARLGIDRVEMPLNLTPAQRDERIKQLIRDQLDFTQPLYEVSKEVCDFDASGDGSWVIETEFPSASPG